MYATTPIGANGLAAWWFSHSYCGEFDSLDPDDTPIWCSGLDTLPWYGREEGLNPSVGSSDLSPPRTDAVRVSEAW